MTKAAPRNLRGRLFICPTSHLLGPPEAESALAKYFPAEMNVTTPDAQPTFVAAPLACIA
jgi:hypothetical protein